VARSRSREDAAVSGGPRLVIEVGVEQRPRVYEDAVSEQESQRLAFWVRSQPQIHRLVHEALRLMSERSAA
jgi:hypothetical protein